MNKLEDKKFLKQLLVSIGVILLYFLWPSIVKLPLQIFDVSFKENGASLGSVIYNVIANILLMVILALIYWKSLKADAEKFRENWKKMLKNIVKFTILIIVSILVVNLIKQYVFGIEEVAENDLYLYTYLRNIPWLMIFMTAVYYPIVEQIVFSKTVKDVISNKWLFIIVSSLFFWYFNVAYIGFSYITVMSSLYYFVGQFIYALSYSKTDNVYVPIIVKMLYNLWVTFISL